jgi:retron-type reverse transcriptase
MLAGAPETTSAIERCVQALGRSARWLRPLCTVVTQRFAATWHDGARLAIAQAVIESPSFVRAWHGANPPAIVRYPLTPPRMAPPPLAIRYIALPELPTPGSIAQWLGIGVAQLEWYADRLGTAALGRQEKLRHYSFRWLPKRSGGFRLLEIPKPRLLQFQRRILAELLAFVPPHEAAHGFRTAHSSVTNARAHLGQAVVLRMDLQDFFIGISAARVDGLLRTLGYPQAAARILTGLCTARAPASVLDVHDPARYDFELPQLSWRERKRYLERHLPQGAPTSPALANLCAFRLDLRLSAAADDAGARYTRYADDLTFSGGKGFARRTARFVSLAAAIAAEEGFAVNHRKTRVMPRGQRQEVTGVVVNARPNLRRDAYDRLKATLTNCARRGPKTENRDAIADFRAHLAGRIAHAAMLNVVRGAKLRALFKQIDWS